MLPAHPPNSRRSDGTRKETFRMWICSGRMWSLKRPGNTMIESKANDPQISVDTGRRGDCDAGVWVGRVWPASQVKRIQDEAGGGQAARFEHEPHGQV